MYQGINDFTLTGKDVISFDFDRSTGKARMKVYGDTYIGDKDRTTYMEYTQDKGVDIKGMFHIEQGSTGWKNMEGLPDEIQAAADLAQEAKDAIDNAAVGSVNLLRNSGFTGDYETEDLSAATELSADTELFSKQLEYWTGVATVSADSDAGSGYSAAIGSLSQSVSLIKGESYVISYKARVRLCLFRAALSVFLNLSHPLIKDIPIRLPSMAVVYFSSVVPQPFVTFS